MLRELGGRGEGKLVSVDQHGATVAGGVEDDRACGGTRFSIVAAVAALSRAAR